MPSLRPVEAQVLLHATKTRLEDHHSQVRGPDMLALMRRHIVEKHGKPGELDRAFDLAFWQAQPPKARFDATWDLVVHAARVKGIDVRQLRLQRSIEAFGRQTR